jgi:MYXO-CTERM domain-containing protein
MQKLRRGLAAAALFAVPLTGAPALAQESNTQAGTPAGTVGPAELRGFSLPGQRTTPPATVEPAPKAETPRPATTTPPAATRPSETRTAPTRTAPAAPRVAEPARSTAPAAPAAPLPAEPEAAAPSAVPTVEQPVAADPLPVNVEPQAPAAQQPPSPAETGWSWLWLAILAVLALAGFLALRRRRDSEHEAEAETEAPEPRAEAEERPRRLAETLPPAPKPAAKPALKLPPKVRAVPPAPPQPVGPRAALEVQFIPARASATDDAAVVEFELVLKNVGDAPATNIRIDTQMFNASATKEMAAFLKGPIHEQSGSPHVQIAPGDELRLQSAMAMPKQDVQEILMQGQRLFVPAVAANVAWDWDAEGRERVALSWLVGRETENRAAKMGAFRLDLGPRIYRQVGVRPLKLVA